MIINIKRERESYPKILFIIGDASIRNAASIKFLLELIIIPLDDFDKIQNPNKVNIALQHLYTIRCFPNNTNKK